ncbi:hypothetical protein BO83DRAFT_421836 [Aspergillus eucalypticola CBS 122712]|uniref:AAA+ ATPase domain-containing protein n=1 Tax=Aspergillus eucalypticola (strain CBS 122712 / IBT 29274) TaxID=1448314 RepID=A0A317ULS6_ASPEC|nr:uncharacterized protein BO83DRAFT_421836 [Aspergillus eucalypticola CBS 122712]PWY62168.1 hypothetical protein BO83DRAFT_421836 [Aspergillus eucalypticola CBS 122712]
MEEKEEIRRYNTEALRDKWRFIVFKRVSGSITILPQSHTSYTPFQKATLAMSGPPTDDTVPKSPISLSKFGMDCTVVEADTPAPIPPTHTTITLQAAPDRDTLLVNGEGNPVSAEFGGGDTHGVDGDMNADSDSDDDEDSLENVLKKYKEAKKYFVESDGITYVPNAQWYIYRQYCFGCHLYVASDVPHVGGETRKSTCKTIPERLPHQQSIHNEHSEERAERPLLPFRVRIMNTLLKRVMDELVGIYPFNCDHVAPYRAIVPYHEKLRKLLQQKEEEFSRLAKIYPDDPAVKRTHSWLPGRFSLSKSHLSSIHPPDDPVTDGTYPGGRDEVLHARTQLDGLRVLIHFLDCDLGDLVRVRQQIVKGTLERIPFPYLWHLFHPGGILRQHLLGNLQIWSSTAFVLTLTLSITALEAYQLELEPRVREILVQRGRKFVDLAKVSHRRYRGLNLRESDFNKYEEIDSDVIIDFELALRSKEVATDLPEYGGGVILEPTEEDPDETHDDYCFYDNKILEKRLRSDFMQHTSLLEEQDLEALSDDSLMLLPPRVYGYVLLSRAWHPLDIDPITEINVIGGDQPDPFDDAVLPEKHRDIVRALVKTHARARGTLGSTGTANLVVKREFDIVKGKGRGLIILLHGAPGVGKTSTAECVAAHTGRPLFPITCGDLGGDSAQEVEANLERFFDMARRWGCVLLLDEADVFLSERIKGDIRQNSLVSVFLRVLEYYSGILILTTNRVGDFDEAAISRIHCALYYPPLDRQRTLEVWRKGIGRLKLQNGSCTIPVKFDRKEILDFARRLWKDGYRWNGRQIKNALQTAVALAEWDKIKDNPDSEACPELKFEHLDTVAKANAHFESYLTQVRTSDDTRAKYNALRRDDLTEKIPDTPSRRKQTTPKSSKKKMRWPILSNDEDEFEEEIETSDSERSSQENSESDSEPMVIQPSKKSRSHQKKKGKDGEKNQSKGRESSKKAGKSRAMSSSKKSKKEPPPESSSSSEPESGSDEQ